MVPLARIRTYLEDLMAADTPIRIHGNGFIQIEPVPQSRINVWHPAIPGQSVYTGIHDHKADFSSTVWHGMIWNRFYKPQFVEKNKRPTEATYRIWVGKPRNRFEGDEDTELLTTDEWVVGGMHPTTEAHQQGSAYFFPRYEFHETIVKNLAITNMQRFNFDNKHIPRVMVPVDQEPSNEWDKHGKPKKQIWDMVFSLLTQETRRIKGN